MKRTLMVAGLLILSAVIAISVGMKFVSSDDRKNDSSAENSDSLSDSTSSVNTIEYPSFDSSVTFPSGEESFSETVSQSQLESSSAASSRESVSSKEESSKEPTSSNVTSSKNESSAQTSSARPVSSEEESSSESSRTESVIAPVDELRAVWISYIDMANIIYKCSETEFTKNFENVCKTVSDFGMNTLIVQVRPFSDAYYPSKLFPWSHTITGTQGKDPGFDPLEIMVRLAHKYNLRFEAWLNPYRVATASVKICDTNPASAWLNTEKVKEVGGKYFYNPASQEVIDLIVSGVEEIVRNYNVDGIHFDDYFYPTTDESFDRASYKEYTSAGGKLSLEEFRRQNVTKMLKATYRAVKKLNSDVVFGISPNGNNNTNYNSLYLDIKSVIENDCLDYICPQIYYGFEHGSYPFEKTVTEWIGYAKNSSVKVYVGLAAYKTGVSDQWAGTGKNEWTKHTDILKRQVEYLRSNSTAKGFVLYCYSSLFAPSDSVAASAKKEKDNLFSILKP